MYLLTGKKHEQYRRMYVQSISSMLEHLYSHTPHGTAYIADLEGGQKDHKMDHLVCFAPGMLALGVKHGVVDGEQAERHMSAARELMRTCYDMYHLQQPSGIGAEYSRFSPEMVPGHDASYKLRPETVESLFVLWRVTGEVQYREWGWEIWSNIDKHCRVDGGYAALMDVRQPERKEDKMESFFLAETLKYLYLLFSDNSLIPIFPSADSPDYFVFNTECHPIKVRLLTLSLAVLLPTLLLPHQTVCPLIVRLPNLCLSRADRVFVLCGRLGQRGPDLCGVMLELGAAVCVFAMLTVRHSFARIHCHELWAHARRCSTRSAADQSNCTNSSLLPCLLSSSACTRIDMRNGRGSHEYCRALHSAALARLPLATANSVCRSAAVSLPASVILWSVCELTKNFVSSDLLDWQHAVCNRLQTDTEPCGTATVRSISERWLRSLRCARTAAECV